MSIIDEIRRDHEDLARVLKKHKGIRKTVEELYPDSAHFIYELLQNAEDTGAKNVCFFLDAEKLTFEHDGRPFSEADIKAITDIGEGTKADEVDKIGRFGVGFKAVFAYSETPYIWSPSHSFMISELVLPNEIDSRRELGQKTLFEFPFNNPKKPVETARAEVQQGLEQLAETTLLFLSNIESIQWQGGESNWEILRVPHSEFHIEILKHTNDKIVTSSHYLRFSESVDELERQRVAIAYELSFLPDNNRFSPSLELSKQFRIVPAEPGKVAVFFPAEKETSGLRFHLHAPFVPELSRSSIKDTPVNRPLYDQLAKLSAKALHKIRDLKLLNADFLAVLPNPQDPVPEPYDQIRKAIISEMNNEPLTPTHAKSYAPAKHLLQAKASLKDLLSLNDIEYLVDHKAEAPQWAIGATQKNSNVDRFLNGLAIKKWDIEEFVETLCEKLSKSGRYVQNRGYVSGPDQKGMAWLSQKAIEWHQQFYALLFREIRNFPYKLKNLIIVRLSDGTYSVGEECYFPGPDVNVENAFPLVDKGVYSSGKNETQRTDAKKLLVELGVDEFSEKEEIKQILGIYSESYLWDDDEGDTNKPNDDQHFKHIEKFVKFLKNNPEETEIFEDADFLRIEGDDDYHAPRMVFLDEPFMDTKLRSIEDILSESPLWGGYGDRIKDKKGFIEFLKKVGVKFEIDIYTASVWNNPDKTLMKFSQARESDYCIRKDFQIPNLKEMLKKKSKDVAQLVWAAVSSADKEVLVAKYRPNQQFSTQTAKSQLVHTLSECPWIPSRDGDFNKPSEMHRGQLPDYLVPDNRNGWLDAIGLLDSTSFEKQRSDISKEDREQKKRAAEILEISLDDVQALKEHKDEFMAFLESKKREFEGRQTPEFPEHKPRNPQLRNARVGEQAANAPGRIVEKRSRSVSIGREGVKAEAVQYLKELYTSDGEMFCQICKGPMPFKLADDKPFFETVEFILGLDARHYQNYLALCPNHSAMFKYANNCEDQIRSLFVSIDDSKEIEAFLAQTSVTIRFTETHICDLKKVIEVDNPD